MLGLALLLAVYGLATLIINLMTKLLQTGRHKGDLIVVPLCGKDPYSELYFAYKRIKTDYGNKIRLAVIDCGITDPVQKEYCREFCISKDIPIYMKKDFPEGFLCGL